MMVENEDFYKHILRTKNILDSYYFFKHIYEDDPRSEYAKCGFENYVSLKNMLELSCNEHIPVVLKVNENTKIYSYVVNDFVPAKFRRCMCCGKLLPFEVNMENDIDIPSENVEISDYSIFDKIYFDLLDSLIEIARTTPNKNKAIAKFKEMIVGNDKTYSLNKKIN